MVAFLSPKRSLVDIVQATGRAMRLSPETGKQFGYVLVPLYVEKARGETIEQAVLRSNFDEVWKVLQGLKEQDDLLAQIIAEMRIERGRTGGFDDSRFRERVELLGPELSLETLRSTITAACLDAIGEQWFERYGQLVAYKQKHGSCDMPARWDENQKLAKWVVKQRVQKRDGNLESEKIELLNRLSFNWNPRETNWRSVYLELIAFRKRFGHCRVPQNWKENNSLAHWVKTQRMDYAKGELERDRIALLEKIGFEWKVGIGTWDERFTELCAFKERFGHTRVKVKWSENPLLGAWVVSQRYKHRRKELGEEYVQRLNAIGFDWDGRIAAKPVQKSPSDPDKNWREIFERFKAYVAANGADVVTVVDEETKKLNRWMLYQRQAKKRGELSEARIHALNEIGFVWQRNARRAGPHAARPPAVEVPITRTWDELFSELVDFFKLHGHCNVPDDWTAQPELARWVAKQRRAKKQNQLTPEQVSRMEEIGFAWSTHDGGWDASRERLAPDRVRRLDEVGFEWDPIGTRWEEMFQRLVEFKKEHGHTNVPQRSPKYAELATWVRNQRAAKTHNRPIIADRGKRLDEIGFIWRLVERNAWERMLERLIEFKGFHGHCNVPQKGGGDKRLGKWVNTQRTHYNRGKLKPDRQRQLEAVGFIWNTKATRASAR